MLGGSRGVDIVSGVIGIIVSSKYEFTEIRKAENV